MDGIYVGEHTDRQTSEVLEHYLALQKFARHIADELDTGERLSRFHEEKNRSVEYFGMCGILAFFEGRMSQEFNIISENKHFFTTLEFLSFFPSWHVSIRNFQVVTVYVTLSFVDFEDGVEVSLAGFNAMSFHPSPNQVLLLPSDVAELVKVVPQRNHKT